MIVQTIQFCWGEQGAFHCARRYSITVYNKGGGDDSEEMIKNEKGKEKKIKYLINRKEVTFLRYIFLPYQQ